MRGGLHLSAKGHFWCRCATFCAAAFEQEGGRPATSWQSAHNFNLVVLGNGVGLMAQQQDADESAQHVLRVSTYPLAT